MTNPADEGGNPPSPSPLPAAEPTLIQRVAAAPSPNPRPDDSAQVRTGEMGTEIVVPDEARHAPLSRLGDYELLQELGRGGMGVVYKARHVRLHRVVALKMILGGLLARPDDLLRFENEAAAAAQLQHPKIVALYEAGTHDGQPFFSMEFVSGTSLAQRLTLGVLPGRQAAGYVEQVARAVHYAHTRGVIHRDLKPANVLLDEHDQPKISDFGLAKVLQSDSGQTRTGAVIGTPAYMAPEQALAKKDVGPACDIYSLGAILFELLTGRPPFRGETALATLSLVAEQEPVPPRLLNPRVDRDLETICLKCLEKDPARRYASAEALADDLHHYLQGEPITARRLGTLGRALKWVRRKPATAALLAVILLALVGFAMLQVAVARQERRLRQDADRQRQEAEHQRQQALDNEHTAQLREQAMRYLAYLAQMRQVQHVWAGADLDSAERLLTEWIPARKQPDLRDWEWYYLQGLCEGRSTLAAHVGRVTALSFSRDGDKLATAGGRPGKPGEVKLWDVASGRRPLPVVTGNTNVINGVALRPDGSLLATAGDDHRVRLVATADGRPRAVLTGHTGHVAAVAFSPDGQLLASAGGDRRIRLWDVGRALEGQGKPLLRTLSGHGGDVTAVAFSPDGQTLASASLDETVRLWDVATGEPRHVLRGHQGEVMTVTFSPDGRRLVSGGGPGLHRGQVRAWDPSTGKPLGVRHGLPGRVLSVSVGRSGQVAAGSNDGLVHVWDERASSEPVVFRADPHVVYALAFRPRADALAKAGADLLATAGGDGRVRLWHDDGGQEALRLAGLPRTEALAFSPDGKAVAVCGRAPGRNGEAQLWRLPSGQPWHTLIGHIGQVHALAFSPDSKQLATGGEDQTVRLYDLADPDEPRMILKGHPGRVLALAFHPGGELLASAGDSEVVWLWDTRTGREVRRLQGHGNAVLGVAFSPDGRWLASGSYDKTVRLWELKTSAVHVLQGHSGATTAVAFSPDGKLLASAGRDRTVRLWDVATQQEEKRLQGLGRPVTALAFHPDGKRLAGVSDDRSVRLWDLVTRHQILELTAGDGVFRAVAFSRGGRYLAAAGNGTGLRVWEAPPERPGR
jgi:WD40 repeat protein/tRNA A-37 threonylcarbamoyl transferase component Bud32